MAYTLEEGQRVYQTCRAIFSGDAALFRKPKKVRETLISNKDSLKAIFEELGETRLVEIARHLLEHRIFASELRAKVAFPDVFRTSTQREAEREASEADAARSVAEYLEDISSPEGKLEEALAITSEDADLEPSQSSTIIQQSTGVLTVTSCSPQLSVPSLYPIYVPYNTQHLILTTAQRVLEDCCFDFAARWFPQVLQEHGWKCASAVELNKWASVLKKKLPKLPSHALASLTDSSAIEIMISTHQLRHTAVHRLPTTVRGISQLLQSAVRLAEVLQDVTRAAQLEDLVSEVDSKIKAMELSKNSLENRAIAHLEEIRRKREQLDQEEKKLVEDMLKEDDENKALIGRLLEASTIDIFERPSSPEEEWLECADVDDGANGVKLNGHGAS
nr:ubiquinol-cytochrome-c reductase cytochrome c1 [Colletotrichum truncatum]KAF6798676.1 ubiquinol-cytochrome-c reductase cytochrome c1 [Colletotrichum truncatum]